tara:strand:+ start:40209 stop:40745 length:537 start_codon:yes stop_codon:yes gene_type:complete
MDMQKELSENNVCLMLISSTEYNKNIVEVMSNFSGKKVCYVTLNKTYDSLKELFKKNKINLKNVVFVDAISKTIKSVPAKTKDCYFVHSPGALTDLSLTIGKLIKQDFEFLIFDSLTNLMIYEKKAPVAKFLSSLVNKIKGTEVKAIFYSLSMNQHSELIQECSMFVDSVIDMTRTSK